MQTSEFWKFDISNLVTAATVATAWIVTKAWDARGVKDGVEALKVAQDRHEKLVASQQKEHEEDSRRRDSTLHAMQLAVQELKLIATFSEKRLAILENREKPSAVERIHERLDDIVKELNKP